MKLQVKIAKRIHYFPLRKISNPNVRTISEKKIHYHDSQKYGLDQLSNLGSPVSTKTRQFQSIRNNVE